MFDSGQDRGVFQKCPAQERGDVGLNVCAVLGRNAVDLRQGHDAVPNAQQGENVEVFAGLRHHAVVGGHDQDDARPCRWRRRPSS